MPKPRKPRALAPGSTVSVIQPSSPIEAERLKRGCDNLRDLDYRVVGATTPHKADGFFAASKEHRVSELQKAFAAPATQGIFSSRGGYGSGELLDSLRPARWEERKVFCGFSDLTCLHIFLWQGLRWVTFYGPNVVEFGCGANATGGYDPDSFMCAMTATNSGWPIALRGESLLRGSATGTLLGGCITLIETSIGTSWELDTRGAILLLEDVNVKPYQLDRMLLHLEQAGKFKGVRGIVLGEFPGSEPPPGSDITARDVCRRLLGPLRIPIVYGAQVGHTPRPMLTVPLGVQARLYSAGEGRLDLLEPAVLP